MAVAAIAWIFHAGPSEADVVTDWNAIATTAVGAGHPGPQGLVDMAIVHAAIHDAIQSYENRFAPYAVSVAGASGSPVAAAATAARDVLVARLPPAQDAIVDATYQTYLSSRGLSGDPGTSVGAHAASAVLALRTGDGSFPSSFPAFTGSTAIGSWRPTAPSNAPMTAPWLGSVKPFTLVNLAGFEAPAPPALNSAEYAEAYNEVKAAGSSTSLRTPEQEYLVRFYNDNFPALWQRTLRNVATTHLTSIGDSARLLALANLATADALICAWKAKLGENFWRPITAIREGDNDGNSATVGDPNWQPAIPTPPYPEYTSGANSVTAAMTRVLALFFGTDHFSVQISSASPSLLPTDPPAITYSRFSDVAKDVVDVRIYHGVHFRFADTEARSVGRRVANHAFKNFLQPLQKKAGGSAETAHNQ